MAKIIKNSILGRIQGSLEDKSIYLHKNAGLLLRTKGGPSKVQMETHPNFEVTRKNQKEFGAGSTAAAALRKGFALAAQQFQNGDYSGALAGKLRLIAQSGKGEHGRRDIHLSNAPQHLLNFEIRKDNLFSKRYAAPLQITLNPARTAIDIHIPITAPHHHRKVPKYITHFQLTVAISVMSTYRYNPKADQYQPTNPHQNAIGTAIQTTPFDLTATYNDIQLTVAMPNDITLAPDGSASVWMGITYGEEHLGQFEPMAVNKAMKCVAIF